MEWVVWIATVEWIGSLPPDEEPENLLDIYAFQLLHIIVPILLRTKKIKNRIPKACFENPPPGHPNRTRQISDGGGSGGN